jgi:hypothetical protein
METTTAAALKPGHDLVIGGRRAEIRKVERLVKPAGTYVKVFVAGRRNAHLFLANQRVQTVVKVRIGRR